MGTSQLMGIDARGATFTSIGRDQNLNYHLDSSSHHATTTINIAIDAGSASESSLQNLVRTIASASNGSHIATTQSCHQQTIAAADKASGLIVSIVHLLMNRTEFSGICRDLKRSLGLLNHTILMTRQALQTFEYTPFGRNLARTIKPAIIDCRVGLQYLFDKLEGCRKCLSVTVIRYLWNRVVWSGLDEQEISLIKRTIATHQVVLAEFLAALNSYVRCPFERITTEFGCSTSEYHGRTLEMSCRVAQYRSMNSK